MISMNVPTPGNIVIPIIPPKTPLSRPATIPVIVD